MQAEGVDDAQRAAGSGPARPRRLGPLPAGHLGQRQRDVPRSGVLPRVPARRGAAAAHLPVHPHLAGRRVARRRSLFAGDPAARGRALRPQPDLRDRHQRRGAAAGARRHLPRRSDAALHAELHAGRRHAQLLGVLHRPLRVRDPAAVTARQHRVLAAQPRLGRTVQRVQRRAVPQRDDLLHAAAAGARRSACCTRAWATSACSASGPANRCG